MGFAGKIKGTIRTILPFFAAWAGKRTLMRCSSISSNSPKYLLTCKLLECSDGQVISGLIKFRKMNPRDRTHQYSIVWLQKKENGSGPDEGRSGKSIEEVAEACRQGPGSE